MSNAARIIDEIDIYLEKSLLKTSKITKEDLIKFIEDKWQEADNEKYNIYQSSIIIARMTNEYIRAKDFKNMMRWLDEDDLLTFEKNPTYVLNYYKGECCLECGNEEKALEFLNLCYSENPDYIFTRAPFCYEFFNKHIENPRQLDQNENEEEDEDDVSFYIELDYWQKFFNEDDQEIYLSILKNDFKKCNKPGKKHLNGINYLKNNQVQILESILNALLEKYPSLQEIYDYSEEDKTDFMPNLTDIKGFANLLSLSTFYITSVYKDDIPYIGFLFSCSWDSEHGLGIMTHKDTIIEIGGADIAFDIYTAKEDLKQSKKK
mgnify:CR=1 FL=1